MNCPNCGGKTKVIDSRDSEQYEFCRWRRRKYNKCNKLFSTYEILPEVLIDAEKAKHNLNKIIEFVKGVEK